MTAADIADSLLPETTLLIAGPGLDPAAVTRALDVAPYRVSAAPKPRWLWTSAGKILSLLPDDHLRAVLVLATVFERQRAAFGPVDLRIAMFLPDVLPRPEFSADLISALRRLGQVSLNLSAHTETVELPHRPVPSDLGLTVSV